jgi:formylglycine-generating enzyme required for sulfatase activity
MALSVLLVAALASCDADRHQSPDPITRRVGAGHVGADPSGAGGASGSGAGGGGGVAPDAAVQGTLEMSPKEPFDAGDCTEPPPGVNCTAGWCSIPAGCFVMGSPTDAWGHPPYQEDQVAVTLTRPFQIQQTEVTLAQWTELGLPTPVNDADGGGDCSDPNCPVANVTWFDAVAFANLLSRSHQPPLRECYDLQGCRGEIGRNLYCQVTTTTATVYECEGFRLPTDAEWEYAARAGTTTAFYSGPITVYGDWNENGAKCNPDPNLETIGWYCWNSGGSPHPSRGLAPNALGLYDMAGNVGEWVNDRSDGAGALSPRDPDGKVDSTRTRNVRGGWFSTWAWTCRMPTQSGFPWDTYYPQVGFRLARTSAPG